MLRFIAMGIVLLMMFVLYDNFALGGAKSRALANTFSPEAQARTIRNGASELVNQAEGLVDNPLN